MGPAAYNKSYEDDDDLPLFISGYAILLLTLYKSSVVAEMGDHGHNRHGPKKGGAVPLRGRAPSLSNTMWPGPRSTSVPSGVFIHSAVWPQ